MAWRPRDSGLGGPCQEYEQRTVRPHEAGQKDQVMEEEELQGVKVLVIDDSKTIRRSAENLLSKEGCAVITATDGCFQN